MFDCFEYIVHHQQLNIIKFKTNQMSRITQELLRKRSEHNECMLTTLEQISLHQQQIVKIQNLDKLCRHLKILYLQNNIIEKMENLSKLKELEYLNLALNNISKIQNIEGCESLRKLDMTVNFVDVLDLHDSAVCLGKLPNLKELYLTGNPCEEWKGCKDYFVANISTLECYNGQVITPSQRIKAHQNLSSLKMSLFEAIEKRKLEKMKQDADEVQRKKIEATLTEQQRNKMKTPYTKDVRRQMYEKMYQDKQKKQRQKNPQKYKEEKPVQMYTKNGQIRQCNEGKFTFRLQQYDDPDYIHFEIQVPKHLETTELQVNINPKWISVRIKNKLTQLRLSEQIIVHESKTERSQITGFLMVKMKKLHPHQFLRRTKDLEKRKLKQEKDLKEKQEKQVKQKRLKLCEEFEKKMQAQQNEIPDLQ